MPDRTFPDTLAFGHPGAVLTTTIDDTTYTARIERDGDTGPPSGFSR
jgi:hypothetical protein